ncbi:MAG: hypothetical protein ACU0BO_04150 [Limimaricola soesokkakensis]|uniref:hypothetical protein n=1 Tax=Limimaricola soesokkakensis TaxID=1343159 RepID=UPI00405888BF
MAKRTWPFENLRILYESYGGIASFVTSSYTLLAVLLTAASASSITSEKWPNHAISILPALAGFSIAAFALYFAILDRESQELLRRPAEQLGGRRPILVLASSIAHALFVQLVALLYAVLFMSAPLEVIKIHSPTHYEAIRTTISSIGQFLTYYGISLVIAAILSIYRTICIRFST